MFDPAYLNGETWGYPGASVEHMETHVAHVFLVDDRAFKIKKDVKLPYVDFSTVEKRRAVIEDELEINRVFAPMIYREVAEVRGEPVLVMNRFQASDMLSWRLSHGGIDRALAERLAETAAEAHVVAPRRETPGREIMLGLGAQLSQAFTDSPDIFQPAETLEFHAYYEAELRRHKHLMNDRSEQGLVCRCHGDMHCGNIVVLDGKPVLFDAIEFSEKIATIDVLYDLAFLLMDLWRHGEKAAANTVLNHYLHLRRDAEDLSGLALLPLFLSTRAGVRALVTADLIHEMKAGGALQQRGTALDYFRASVAYLKPAKPMLVAVGGLSGTGKTSVARRLAPSVGAAPGALHVRTDVERKVMAGVPLTQKLPPEQYTQSASMQVYQRVLMRAEAALQAGQSVIIDAVFTKENERAMAEAVARRAGAAFQGVWLEADADTLKARVTSRKADASDANAEVVEIQTGYDVGRIGWTRISAAGSIAETESAVRRSLPYPPAVRA